MKNFIQVLKIIEMLRILSQWGDCFFSEKALKVFPLLWESFQEIQRVYIYPFGILFVVPYKKPLLI